jgi:SAM-dependent MidA family methyltransferase
MKTIFIILTLLNLPQPEVFALSPVSILEDDPVKRLYTLKNESISNIEDLVLNKVREIESDNYIKDSALIEDFIKKQVLAAKRSSTLMKACLSDEDYHAHFSYALDRISKICEFFNIDLDVYFKLFMEDTRIGRLQNGLMNFAQFVEEHSLRERLSDTHGVLPESKDINQDNYFQYIKKMLSNMKQTRFSIQSRTEAVLTLSKSEREGFGDEYLVNELLKTFDFFIHSHFYSIDFYRELLVFAEKANIPFKKLKEKYLEYKGSEYERLIEIIRAKGDIDYGELMDTLLYDSDSGFYTRQRDGAIAGGDFGFDQEFSTLPENSPLFGMGVATDCFYRWISLGKPKEFHVVELGAGECGLAYHLMNEVINRMNEDNEWERFYDALKYDVIDINIDRVPKSRKAFLQEHVEFIEADAIQVENIYSDNSVTGVFLSNELIDAFPVRKVRKLNGRIVEVRLEERDGIVYEFEKEIEDEDLLKYLEINETDLSDGQEKIVNIKSMRFLDKLYEKLRKGFIITFDYGALTEKDALKSNLFQSNFRLFGRIRDDMENEFFGVPKSFGNEMFGIDPYEGFLEIYGEQEDQELKARLDFALRSRYAVLKEIFNNPLVAPFQVDITTDVVFSEMRRMALNTGYKKSFIGEQKDYFKKIAYFDPNWKKRIGQSKYFLEDLGGYYAMVLQKQNVLERNLEKEDTELATAA